MEHWEQWDKQIEEEWVAIGEGSCSQTQTNFVGQYKTKQSTSMVLPTEILKFWIVLIN